MTIQDFLNEISVLNNAQEKAGTVDTVKMGDTGRTLTKVAVCMFGTTEVIRQAKEFGAELLIVHEPVFFHDSEIIKPDDPVMASKKQLLDEGQMVLYRYHDHPHNMPDDMIDCGTIAASGLKGHIPGKPFWAVTGFELENPMTARSVAETLEKNLGIEHIRITGAMDVPGKKIAFACGTPGHIWELLRSPDWDFIVTGELCEWGEAEYARDQAQQGGGKAILVLGHCVSERAGMEYFANLMQQKHPELEIRYLECGNVYQFTN